MSYLRHTLCYLKPATQPFTPSSSEGHKILNHWQKQNYPLIYTQQPKDRAPEHIQLALPYYDPVQQKKIRLSFLFDQASVTRQQELPHLQEIFPEAVLPPTLVIRVYGSYCWQYLTQHPYVQPSSDLDVLIPYAGFSLNELRTLHRQLPDQLNIPSLDGEVRFPNLGDCSWQELIQTEGSDRILFKSEHHIELIPRESLYARVPTLLN